MQSNIQSVEERDRAKERKGLYSCAQTLGQWDTYRKMVVGVRLSLALYLPKKAIVSKL